MHIEHVALWARDLEGLRDFYVGALGGRSGPLYENPRTGFRSYFIAFGEGARLELMSRPGAEPRGGTPDEPLFGLAHVALRLGSRDVVEATVARLAGQGAPVLGAPRVTGDGYYEAVIGDPEGNRIELVE
jgi:lactoylglutathione lyase